MTSIEPRMFQALTIKSALKLYANTGMKANRMYTPKDMMQMVHKITGVKLKPRDYHGGVAALQKWIEEQTGVKASHV